MKDSRFQPMRLDEVNRLHCSVSLLLHFEKCRDVLDWQVGVDQGFEASREVILYKCLCKCLCLCR